MKGQILIVSGPSGSGKSTLLSRLLKEEKDLYFSISTTTRAPRQGEAHGVNYYFTDEKEFKKGIDEGEFLEWACVHNIAKSKLGGLITSVFITTANKSELNFRLSNRGTDSAQTIQKRLENAVGEMEHILEYDYFLVNDDLQSCYENLRSILRSIRLRTLSLNVEEIIKNWNN